MKENIRQDAGAASNETNLSEWQNKLLPLMVKMLIGLSIFFFLATVVQLYFLHKSIQKIPELDIKPNASTVVNPVVQSVTPERVGFDAMRWNTLTQLEGHCLQRRYHQANVLLMSRVWFGYLGFITGMICTFIGATFILGKLQEPVTRVAANAADWKLSISTASPGLMLALFGTVLMIATMVSPGQIDVRDGPSFLNSWIAEEGAPPATPDDIVNNLNLVTQTNK